MPGPAAVVPGPAARVVARFADPWRTAARAQLRDDAGSFALAALGLRLPGGEAEVAAHLAEVLGEAGPRVRLTWPGAFPRVVRHPHADVVVVRAAPDGTLTGLRLLPRPPLDPGTLAGLDRAILTAANRVRALAIPRAAPRLARALSTLGGTRAERRYVRRVLAATVLIVEPPDPAGPALPDLRPVTPFGQGMLEVRCVPAPGGTTADLWVRMQHVALDGAPMEELVAAVRAAFGVAQPPVLARVPLAESRPRSSSRRYPAGDPAEEVAVLGVADLGPVLGVRAGLAAAGVPLTLAALLGWLLTRHPAFAGEIVAVPVDLPATDRRARSTTVVACDPGPAGVAGYAAAFGAELALARRRDSAFTHALRAAALLPLPLVGPVARVVPGSGRGVTGTLGVSVLKRSDVFVPAINDVYRAYLGIGDARLPTRDGGTAAAIVLKCRRGELRALAAAADQVLAAPDRFGAELPT
jgi:hypothetical protein